MLTMNAYRFMFHPDYDEMMKKRFSRKSSIMDYPVNFMLGMVARIVSGFMIRRHIGKSMNKFKLNVRACQDGMSFCEILNNRTDFAPIFQAYSMVKEKLEAERSYQLEKHGESSRRIIDFQYRGTTRDLIEVALTDIYIYILNGPLDFNVLDMAPMLEDAKAVEGASIYKKYIERYAEAYQYLQERKCGGVACEEVWNHQLSALRNMAGLT